MTQKWIDAARRYNEIEGVPAPQQELVQVDTWHDCTLLKIADAGRELERFVREEGRAAMGLLRAAKRRIIFGENAEGGYTEVFFIDANGIQKSHEAQGTWTVSEKELPKPKISRAQFEEAAKAAVWYARRKPEEVLTWLRSELDKIANEVM